MKTNSFLTKPLLLSAVLLITSLSTVQAASEKCTIKYVKPVNHTCTTKQIWVTKGKQIEYKTSQFYRKEYDKQKGKTLPAEKGYIKEIQILKGKRVVKSIKPSKRSMGSGKYTVPLSGHYKIKAFAHTHRKSSSLFAKISHSKKSKKK